MGMGAQRERTNIFHGMRVGTRSASYGGAMIPGCYMVSVSATNRLTKVLETKSVKLQSKVFIFLKSVHKLFFIWFVHSRGNIPTK